jgi:histidinol phosphatase-like enzyme (inositol monophosphatase family)
MHEDSLTTARLIETAHLLADASGPAILRHFRCAVPVDNKAGTGGFDPVTEGDRAGERVIREHLGRLHPDHAILGEEMGHSPGSAAYTWVIDPIDGTRAFITGMPLWGTLIGVTEHGRAVAGMMDQPYTRERIWSAGDTTYWRGPDGAARPVQTAPCPTLAEARLTTTSPDLFTEPGERSAFEKLKRAARLTRFGGDCYAYCLLAAGHIDVIVEAGLKPYDIVALVPIIEAAGGIVTTWEGERPEGGGRILACGDKRVHAEVLRVTSDR